MKNNNSTHKWISLIILFIISIPLFFTNIATNIFSLIIEKEYFIPKQSSIFTFKETLQNEGSSDVWRYGEDYTNYYYNLSTFNNDVLFFPKNKAKTCPRFNSKNITTWCQMKIPETIFNTESYLKQTK